MSELNSPDHSRMAMRPRVALERSEARPAARRCSLRRARPPFGPSPPRATVGTTSGYEPATSYDDRRLHHAAPVLFSIDRGRCPGARCRRGWIPGSRAARRAHLTFSRLRLRKSAKISRIAGQGVEGRMGLEEASSGRRFRPSEFGERRTHRQREGQTPRQDLREDLQDDRRSDRGCGRD